MRILTALIFLVAVSAAHAQSTPVGLWRTIDDNTHLEKSLVRISESAGVVTGRIEKLLHPTRPDPLCEKCSDDRHGKPITGLTIIAGLKQHGEVWEGGQILDPENGKTYTVRLKPLEGGLKLEVRGYIGPFFRNQTWVRVE
ncbi:MAG: DUF2147 domain-containing protein [Steroidobacteraceae bacterium]